MSVSEWCAEEPCCNTSRLHIWLKGFDLLGFVCIHGHICIWLRILAKINMDVSWLQHKVCALETGVTN